MVFTVYAFIACEEEKTDEIQIKPKHSVPVDPTISTDFNSNTFSSKVEEELLKEIKICDPNAERDDDELHPACSPKMFRFFKLNQNQSLKNGFIVLVKAGVGGFPLRRVLIFQREQGVLVKVNGFIGNLIEKRKGHGEYEDLVIRFSDKVYDHLTYYNCLFTWKNGKYEYVNCEVIDEGEPRRVKAEFVDSMAVEIKKILDKNKMIF